MTSIEDVVRGFYYNLRGLRSGVVEDTFLYLDEMPPVRAIVDSDRTAVYAVRREGVILTFSGWRSNYHRPTRHRAQSVRNALRQRHRFAENSLHVVHSWSISGTDRASYPEDTDAIRRTLNLALSATD